jgi:hypothetical protein
MAVFGNIAMATTGTVQQTEYTYTVPPTTINTMSDDSSTMSDDSSDDDGEIHFVTDNEDNSFTLNLSTT